MFMLHLFAHLYDPRVGRGCNFRVKMKIPFTLDTSQTLESSWKRNSAVSLVIDRPLRE